MSVFFARTASTAGAVREGDIHATEIICAQGDNRYCNNTLLWMVRTMTWLAGTPAASKLTPQGISLLRWSHPLAQARRVIGGGAMSGEVRVRSMWAN